MTLLTSTLIVAAICVFPQTGEAEVCVSSESRGSRDMCGVMFGFNRAFLSDTSSQIERISFGATEEGKPLAKYVLSVGASKSQIEADLKTKNQSLAVALQGFSSSVTEQICDGWEMGSFVRAGGSVSFDFFVSADKSRPLSLLERFTTITISSCEAP